MKRTGFCILAVFLILLAYSCALADADHFCDEMPQGVAELQSEHNPDGVFSDCIVFTDTPQGEICWVLTPWNLKGYRLENGVWQVYAQLDVMDQENAPDLFFRRHAKGQADSMQSKAGLSYPDGLGFDIVRGDRNAPSESWDILQYHWMQKNFALIGWQKNAQFALLQDGKWCFYDMQSGQALGSARMDALNEYSLMIDFDALPDTIDEAQKMEAITRSAAAALFPDWTMTFYEEYNSGHAASAGYYRVDDGWLTIRRIDLDSDVGGVSAKHDTMPVLLSQSLLNRLQTEPIDTLLDTSSYGDTFLVKDFLDDALFPGLGKALQNDLQSRGLLLLTEDDNSNRFLVWIAPYGSKYAFHTSGLLPSNTTLDLFHSGDSDLSLEWNEQRMQCGAALAADGTWRLDWVMGSTAEGSTIYGSAYCGVINMAAGGDVANILVGAHPWRNLFEMDVGSLPTNFEDVKALLDRDGWAVVNNPDPKDRLHLRTKPDRNSTSLGKFYNRTPVQVLGQKGDWSRVRIGLDGRLEGWMLSQYLTIGNAMDDVASASPDKTLRLEHENCELFAATVTTATTGIAYGGMMWIAGVVEDEWYIMLDTSGNTGYLPQSWLWEGNG